MSRSRKKFGIHKDKGIKEYNRIFRRVNKIRVRLGLEPKKMEELINPYDIHDYIHIWDGDLIEKERFERLHEFYKPYISFAKYKRNIFKK